MRMRATWFGLSLTFLAAGCNPIEDIGAASGSTIEVNKGGRFSITRGASPTVSPEYQYSWEAPVVSGAAVVYEGPGGGERDDKMPGSSSEQVFVFRAVEAGQADILIKLKAGAKVENRSDYTLRIRVR